MNVLVTSSIRIDTNQPSAVDPSSPNGFDVTKDTIIYIRRSFIDWYNDLQQRGFNDMTIRELYPFDEFAQLQQIRSKFHRASAYLLFRSCSPIANDIRTYPVTIWTLADQSIGPSKISNTKIASRLFQTIATSVWTNGENAALKL
jgi:hypothetical protein